MVIVGENSSSRNSDLRDNNGKDTGGKDTGKSKVTEDEDYDPADIHGVYYVSPTDTLTSGANKQLLTGPNYLSWKYEMLRTLTFKNKLDFVNGNRTTPALESKMYVPWLRCNNIVLSWILHSLSDDIRSTVMFSQIASDLWNKLDVRYSSPAYLHIYTLQMKIYGLEQGSMSVRDYFGLISKMWEELRQFRPLPDCICEEGKPKSIRCVYCNTKVDMMFQFFMGLNPDFDYVRGHIIMNTKKMTLDEAFKLCTQEEAQKGSRFGGHVSGGNVAGFNQNVNAGFGQNVNLAVKNKRKDKDRLYCDNCGRPGHVVDNCYRLIGFPPNFKFTKKAANSTPGQSSQFHGKQSYGQNSYGQNGYGQGTNSQFNYKGSTSYNHGSQASQSKPAHFTNQVASQDLLQQYSQVKSQMKNLMSLMGQTVHAQGGAASDDSGEAEQSYQSSTPKMAGSFFKDKDWAR